MNKDCQALASRLFPDVQGTPQELEARFPPRALAENACVTRIAPSPTGFLHFGNLYGVLTDERLAHQSGGVIYLRIEDTDAKREVPGAVADIMRIFAHFGIRFDEGKTPEGEIGAYGPYLQTQRAPIYHVYAKSLVGRGLAYPCFATEEELAAMRERQEAEKITTGYWGAWAVWRDADPAAVSQKLDEGAPWVLRLRSPGDPANRVTITDGIKGTLNFPENDQDIVLLKSDGIPTYHFAHAVDDHLMRTTHVVRGEEWLATLPIHVQLFDLLGFDAPVYCHTAVLLKQEGASKRKLSKRKDPEFNLTFYIEQGYPVGGVLEYMMTLLNSNFEEWRLANPEAPLTDFAFSLDKMSVSGALFDMTKLHDVCKNTVARMSADEVYAQAAAWAAEYEPAFYALFIRDPDYTKAILSIGRGGDKPRRDITLWSDLPDYMGFFFEERFTPDYTWPACTSPALVRTILARYAETYDTADDQTAWFAKIKELAGEIGFAPETKLFRKNPGMYPGHAGDVSMVLRVAVTGRQNSPDLHAVMGILGKEGVKERLAYALNNL